MNTSDNYMVPVGSTDRNIKTLFLPYILTQVALLAVIQIVTWIRGPEIDLVDALLLVPSWFYMAWFQYRHRVPMAQVRFGTVVPHAATFVIVVGSYHLAAFARAVTNEAAGSALPLDGSWFGVLIGMTAVWSVFLVAHIAYSVSQRGFES